MITRDTPNSDIVVRTLPGSGLAKRKPRINQVSLSLPWIHEHLQETYQRRLPTTTSVQGRDRDRDLKVLSKPKPATNAAASLLGRPPHSQAHSHAFKLHPRLKHVQHHDARSLKASSSGYEHGHVTQVSHTKNA
ncbi:hypothetical protein EJ02DRAFT_513320 [Clathrospora elynae]|uniref:Uncharacterized protein n=1 Tax=Clathrospora elynae TaxID=706981 RepID=A0A6A5SKR0_9PLEO|nr:hypothetical protein EJ02DRAFT_513320 [Clathrospora elynae]